jgi:multidrug efflux pump subunit AcrA (membrane-fusion protein)
LTVNTRTWKALPWVGLVAIAATGCASMRGESGTPQNPMAAQAQASQRRSHQALQRAADAQKRAADQEKRATAAQQQVQRDQQKLLADQARARQEQQKAEQLQREANQATQAAARQAPQAQQQAENALSQQGQLVRRGEQTIAGHIASANRNQIVLRPPEGYPMAFAVTDQTKVSVDGRTAHATDLREGQEARVAYSVSGTQPTALVVQVLTGNPMGATQGTGSGTSDTGTSSSPSGAGGRY